MEMFTKPKDHRLPQASKSDKIIFFFAHVGIGDAPLPSVNIASKSGVYVPYRNFLMTYGFDDLFFSLAFGSACAHG